MNGKWRDQLAGSEMRLSFEFSLLLDFRKDFDARAQFILTGSDITRHPAMYARSPRPFPHVALKRRPACRPIELDSESTRTSNDWRGNQSVSESSEVPTRCYSGPEGRSPSGKSKFRLPFSFEAERMQPPCIEPPGRFDWMGDSGDAPTDQWEELDTPIMRW
jgi:hypothetical protein